MQPKSKKYGKVYIEYDESLEDYKINAEYRPKYRFCEEIKKRLGYEFLGVVNSS